MDKQLTVGELIELLGKFDPNMPVEMGMNQEYQSEVSADMIFVEQYSFHNNGQPYLMIGD